MRDGGEEPGEDSLRHGEVDKAAPADTLLTTKFPAGTNTDLKGQAGTVARPDPEPGLPWTLSVHADPLFLVCPGRCLSVLTLCPLGALHRFWAVMFGLCSGTHEIMTLCSAVHWMSRRC